MTSQTLVEVRDFRVSTFQIPTETPEADGTLDWDSTTMVMVELLAGEKWGMGFTYGHACLKGLICDLVQHCVLGKNNLNTPLIWGELERNIRNNGEVGLTAMAMSAIDVALWDLKAKHLHISLSELLGQAKSKIEVYGSGGFTNFSDDQIKNQFETWSNLGIKKFKMKVGRDPDQDAHRVKKAKAVIGEKAQLFVDANGAYDFQTALKISEEFEKYGVTWFEQPINPTDLDGMRELQRRLPRGMDLASGEYIYDLSDLEYGIQNQAQHFIQLDVTRCKGITGFVKGAATCEVHHIPISSHCAPSLHVALGCAFDHFKHIEYFFDHARIEKLLFTGVPEVVDGYLSPDLSKSGHGLSLNLDAAEKYRR